MPEPTVKLKFKSLGDLESEAMKVEMILKREGIPEKLMKSVKSLCHYGELDEKEEDLELAYIHYYRCILSIQRLRELKEFNNDSFYYKAMIKDYASTSMARLECLKPILLDMYKRESNAYIASENVKELVDRFNDEESSAQNSSVDRMKEISIDDESRCISSVELNCVVTSRKFGENTTLIIDVRSEDDFEKSRMILDDVINIPANELPDGLTPSMILNTYLKSEFKLLFEKRKEYDWVILVDWFSNREDIYNTKCPIGKIMTVIKWDFEKKYKRKPVVLKGGFEDWLSYYPLKTTNPQIDPPRKEIDNSRLLIEDINFPSTFDLDTAFIEEDDNKFRTRPTFDRSTKPVLHDRESEPSNNIATRNRNERISRTYEEDDGLDRSDVEKTYVINENSDIDDELNGEMYSQRGRRSALANTSSKMVYHNEKTSDNDDEIHDRYASEHGNDYNDNDESEAKLIGKNDLESTSNMRRTSSTPNISKLSINEGRIRPPVNRSTKPISSNEQSNAAFMMRNDYSSSEIGRGLIGLKNLGNTCYMNSIIQCLSNTELLKQNLLSLDPRKINRMSKTQGLIANALRIIFMQLWSGDKGSVSCKDLKTIVGEHRDSFTGYEQQDSHEFLTILIDWLHEDLKQTPESGKLDGADENSGEKAWGEFTRKNNSIIRKLFYGQLKSTVSCSVCRKESITFEPFSNLSLPLPSEETCSLADCLKLYVSNESILGWQCPGCKTSRSATKKLDITKLPPLLVIHLKRFTSDGMCRKRVTTVKFPSLLDMSDFVTGSEQRFSQYQLYAVSNHYGTMESGHYTAYCLNAPSGNWYKFDDQEVTSLKNSVPKLSAAYIVFYQYITN